MSKRTRVKSGGSETDGLSQPAKRMKQASGSPANKPRSDTKDDGPTSSDPATWRESTVPEDSMITKGDAQSQYRLSKADFMALPKPIEHETQSAWTCLLYPERAVERKAWEKHGGPEGWLAYLGKLRKRHLAQHLGKRFNEPQSREPVVAIVCLQGALEPRRDPPRVQLLKEQFKHHFSGDWVWELVNKKYDEAGSESEFPYSVPGLCMRDRIPHLQKALKTLPRYPPRVSRLPSSASMDALREVLGNAPIWRGDDTEEEGLDIHYDGLSGNVSAHWSEAMYDKVYVALTRVVQEVGQDAWKAARWEVYDRYIECVGVGIHNPKGYYSQCMEPWNDDASSWLQGRCNDRKGKLDSLGRNNTNALREYNRVLPVLGPGE